MTTLNLEFEIPAHNSKQPIQLKEPQLNCNLTLKPPQIMNVGWQDQHPHFKKLPRESCKDLFLYVMQWSRLWLDLLRKIKIRKENYCTCFFLLLQNFNSCSKFYQFLIQSIQEFRCFPLNMFFLYKKLTIFYPPFKKLLNWID